MKLPLLCISILCFGLFLTLCQSSLEASEPCAVTIQGGKITLRGSAKAEDGDTIWVGIHKIRLYGIEALEEDQPCYVNNERRYCSERSFKAVSELIKGRIVKCQIDIGKRGEPIMSYNRYLATCYLPDGTELNRKLVRDGWAIADPSAKGDIYRGDQKFAEANGLGIHVATFMSPKNYRRSMNKPAKQCPEGYQCVRSTRNDIQELLNEFRKIDGAE